MLRSTLLFVLLCLTYVSLRKLPHNMRYNIFDPETVVIYQEQDIITTNKSLTIRNDNNSIQNEESMVKRVRSFSDNLVVFCSQIAVNNTIMTTITDSGYIKQFYVFYRLSHMERYPQFFATAIDKNAYDDIKSHGIPVYLYSPHGVNTNDLKTGSTITSKAFYSKVTNKLKYIYDLLQLNYRLLYMDCDIILFKNPWTYLNRYSTKNADLVTQKDDSLNSGFMLLFPTVVTKLLIRSASYHMLLSNYLDQESIIFVLPQFQDIRLILLPENLFSNGRVFFSRHQFYWDTIEPELIMMHNNYIVGSHNKIYRWREMLFYKDEDSQYYSLPTRQYLMVDASANEMNSTLYLMRAAVLSRLTNRTFLLPTFPCPIGIQCKRCNLCRNDVECFKRFGKLIKFNFREFSFRENELTPKDVRIDIKMGLTYTLKETDNKTDIESNCISNSIIYLPRKGNMLNSIFERFSSLRVFKISGFTFSFPKKL